MTLELVVLSLTINLPPEVPMTTGSKLGKKENGKEKEKRKQEQEEKKKRNTFCHYIPWVLVLLVSAVVGGIEESR